MVFTLSCADRMWKENFSSLLEDMNDIKLEYEVLPNGISKTTVKFIEDGNEESMELQEFLKHKVDESEHEMIRTNLLNATRKFQHRVTAFIKHIMCGDNQPMKIKNLSYKVEFQGRGAGHIHGVLWIDLAELEEDSPIKNGSNENSQPGKNDEMSNQNYLTSAFDKLRLSKQFQRKKSVHWSHMLIDLSPVP